MYDNNGTVIGSLELGLRLGLDYMELFILNVADMFTNVT